MSVNKYPKAAKPSEHGPREPASGGPASAEGLKQVTSISPFQPQPFCDSVKSCIA